jgi:hypothetical protein
MALAGLWENWRDRSTGERIRSFAIVTTEPNELCARLHNRMPVVLGPEAWPAWLGEEPIRWYRPPRPVTHTCQDPSLLGLELQEIYGIGERMEQRLHRAGIRTVARLWNATPFQLRQVWGGINGLLFHQRLCPNQ